MARVDRILALVQEQGANELRLGTDALPQMLAHGASRRLSMPVTDETTLRDHLGELLRPEREALLTRDGRLETTHHAEGAGAHWVTFTRRGESDGFDVVFVRGGGRARPASTKISEPEAAARTAPAAPPAPAAPSPVVTLATQPGEAPVAPALLELLAHVPPRASDLHLAEGEPPMVRIDGALRELAGQPTVGAELLALRADLEARLASERSVEVAIALPDGARGRANVFYTERGRALALRVLPRMAPTLASLQMPVALDPLVGLPHGLVLVCGATGSGKSTTLAALARELLSRRSVVLVTLEDPIEYGLTGSATALVRRRQIGRDVPDFAAGLRDALRQDPDAILIGELRDAETIGLALTAAETGHLVLASLHSGSAASCVERIVDAYPPMRAQQIRVQLADVLRAVVAQRLLPRARGAGRVVALEVMLGTSAVGALIREGKTAQLPTTIQAARREGMITLERSLADRVLAGDVRIEDARAAANHRAALEQFLAR